MKKQPTAKQTLTNECFLEQHPEHFGYNQELGMPQYYTMKKKAAHVKSSHACLECEKGVMMSNMHHAPLKQQNCILFEIGSPCTIHQIHISLVQSLVGTCATEEMYTYMIDQNTGIAVQNSPQHFKNTLIDQKAWLPYAHVCFSSHMSIILIIGGLRQCAVYPP